MDDNRRVADEVLASERAGLDRWAVGDPSGFLEICAPDVTYFDPYLPARIDGRETLARYYETLRGKVHIDRYILLSPRVDVHGDTAVLTFNYVSWVRQSEHRWNATEVYRLTGEGWRIVQTHWSKTPAQPSVWS